MAARGALIVPMAGTYPLRDAAKALERVGASTPVGSWPHSVNSGDGGN